MCYQPTPFFTKHDGLKSQGRRSIGRHLPLPQMLLLSRPMITDEATKAELKIYDVKFEIWRGDWRNAASEYRMQGSLCSQI